MAERKRRPRTVDTIREHSQGLIEMMKATPRECWSRAERAKIRGFITEALEILENDPEEKVEFIRFIRNMFKDCARDWNTETKPPSSHSAEFDQFDDRKGPRRIAVRMMRESTPILRDSLKRITSRARYAELYVLVDTVRPELEAVLAHLEPSGKKKTAKKKTSKKGPAPRRRGRRPGSSAERNGFRGKKTHGMFSRLGAALGIRGNGEEEDEEQEEVKPRRKKKATKGEKAKTRKAKAPSEKKRRSKKKTSPVSKKKKVSNKPDREESVPKRRRKKREGKKGEQVRQRDIVTGGLDPVTEGENGSDIKKDVAKLRGGKRRNR